MADVIDYEKKESEESSGIDYRMIWSIVVLNWYWFIISVMLCVGAALLYLRYQPSVYQSSTKILIKDEKGKSGGADMTLDQLGIITNSNGFENELEILKSTAIATRAVKKLKLYVTYILEGRVTEAELYKSSPILVDLEEGKLDQLKTAIPIEITKTGDESIMAEIMLPIHSEEGDVMRREIDSFPTIINTPVGKLVFSRNPGINIPERKLTATIIPPISMGRSFAGKLQASPTSKMTTVAQLSILDTQPARAIDYLEELVNSYNEDANEDKNEIAEKTKAFIDERIEVIQSELNVAEGRIEGYKVSNRLVNLPTDANTALTQATEFQKKQVDIQTQMSLVKSLIEYVQNPSNNLMLIPVNLGVQNTDFNKMVGEYNNLILKRNRMIRSSSEGSPAVVQATDEAQAMWDAITQHLRNIYSELNVQRSSIERQYNLFSGKMTSTPMQERAMNDMGRQQQIKAQLYLMLAERREENYISLASTANKARIIDMPQMTGKVSPKSSMITLSAFIFGLFLPLGIFYLREMLRFRIEGRGDLEKATNIPIVADIPLTTLLAEGERAIVVKENKNNLMEEAFRGLRTNLRFLLSPGEKVICTTSTVPGEGKTFVATNLAMSLALLGKRVIVIGLDIRKPRLVKLFNLPSGQHGITTYLAGETADFNLLEQQICRGVANPNLDVLPAGVIPPNPGELITRDLLDKAIEYFKEKYDYIVLDTPPIGLVSDTYELARLADITLCIVRSEVSTKADIELLNKAYKEQKLPKVNIVFNGVNLKKKKYGFYYGYGRYGGYSKYGTYYGRYGHYGSYGNYGDSSSSKKVHVEK